MFRVVDLVLQTRVRLRHVFVPSLYPCIGPASKAILHQKDTKKKTQLV